MTIILDSSAAGETAEGILALHPTLTPDAIRRRGRLRRASRERRSPVP
ncbi:MAG TPA: hypothetical protein VNM91_06745 [Dehalococcoidia bacterium]|nr:hypothetical protein [Dehalococcoidia bacterium]